MASGIAGDVGPRQASVREAGADGAGDTRGGAGEAVDGVAAAAADVHEAANVLEGRFPVLPTLGLALGTLLVALPWRTGPRPAENPKDTLEEVA